MRKDQIFVLLLIVLLPLSGCMDGAIGDADAQENSETQTTTVVNNFYNNTSVDASNEVDYKYIIFDEEVENGQWNQTINVWNNDRVLLGSFNTTAESLFSVVYSAYACEQTIGWSSSGSCTVYLLSTCGDVEYPAQLFTIGTSETTAYMIHGTASSNCTHQVVSGMSLEQLSANEYIRLHYEIGFKQIPVSLF